MARLGIMYVTHEEVVLARGNIGLLSSWAKHFSHPYSKCVSWETLGWSQATSKGCFVRNRQGRG